MTSSFGKSNAHHLNSNSSATGNSSIHSDSKAIPKPFLMLASWFSLAAYMTFVISDLVQAILKLARPVG
jgi:hypothetical protein